MTSVWRRYTRSIDIREKNQNTIYLIYLFKYLVSKDKLVGFPNYNRQKFVSLMYGRPEYQNTYKK